jgi:hypothetical protein
MARMNIEKNPCLSVPPEKLRAMPIGSIDFGDPGELDSGKGEEICGG